MSNAIGNVVGNYAGIPIIADPLMAPDQIHAIGPLASATFLEKQSEMMRGLYGMSACAWPGCRDIRRAEGFQLAFIGHTDAPRTIFEQLLRTSGMRSLNLDYFHTVVGPSLAHPYHVSVHLFVGVRVCPDCRLQAAALIHQAAAHFGFTPLPVEEVQETSHGPTP